MTAVERFMLIAVLAALALLSPARAAPIETLVATDECPIDGPDAACLTLDVYDAALTATEVVGRLNNGPVSRYLLQQNLSFQTGTPYLGQSARNHPLILTTPGPLEVRSKGWGPARAGTDLVDERRWKIIAQFIYPPTGDLVVTTPDDIGIWDEKRQLCISARLEPRRLSIIKNGCGARGAPAASVQESEFNFWLRAPGRLSRWIDAMALSAKSGLPTRTLYDYTEPVSAGVTAVSYERWPNTQPQPVRLRDVQRLYPDEINIEMGQLDDVAEHFGGGGVGIDVYRIQNSPYLLFSISHDGGD